MQKGLKRLSGGILGLFLLAIVAASCAQAPAAAPTTAPAAPPATTAAAKPAATTAASAAPAATTSAQAAATSAAPAAATQEVIIPIGGSFNLTGTNANLSIESSRAAEMAIAQVNEKGIKVGNTVYKFKLIQDDDSANATKAVSVLNKHLYTDKVKFLFTFSSISTIATQPLVDAAPDVLQFALTNAAGIIAKQHPNTFRLTQTPAEYAGPWVEWIVKNRPELKTVFVLDSDNPGIQAGVVVYKKAFDAYGIKTVGEGSFLTTATDFYTLIDKVIAAKPDAVSVRGDVPGPIVYSQLREKGYKGAILAQTGVDPNAFKVAGNAMEGVLAHELDTKSPLVPAGITQFLKDYQAKYNALPSMFSTEFYSYPFVLASAIAKAQSIEAPKLTKVMETEALDSPWGPIRFGGAGYYGINHQAYTPSFVSEVKGGAHAVLASISPEAMVASQKKLFGQ